MIFAIWLLVDFDEIMFMDNRGWIWVDADDYGNKDDSENNDNDSNSNDNDVEDTNSDGNDESISFIYSKNNLHSRNSADCLADYRSFGSIHWMVFSHQIK